MILRIVTKNFQILELVVRLTLFKNKLNSDELAAYILQTIQRRLALEISEWMSIQLDRVSTNTSLNYCASHGLNNVGKNSAESCKLGELFRKLYQAIIQYNGKVRTYAASKFGKAVITAHGVRYFPKTRTSDTDISK